LETSRGVFDQELGDLSGDKTHDVLLTVILDDARDEFGLGGGSCDFEGLGEVDLGIDVGVVLLLNDFGSLALELTSVVATRDDERLFEVNLGR